MKSDDHPVKLMADQFLYDSNKTRLEIIKKSIATCADTGKIIPDAAFWELTSEGEYAGEKCECYRCSEIAKKSRGRLQI
ncbi:hypothetical protein [Methanospirillum sp.]